MFEIQVQCPHCWTEITLLLDPSVPVQTYVEDCGLCCNPLEVSVRFQGGEPVFMEVRPAQ